MVNLLLIIITDGIIGLAFTTIAFSRKNSMLNLLRINT